LEVIMGPAAAAMEGVAAAGVMEAGEDDE